MKFRDLLNREGISSRGTLQEYIRKNYENASHTALRILKKDDLETDSENRIYDANVKFENVILDIENLSVLDATSVEFSHCIFTGSLNIGQHMPNFRIKLFRCVFGGDVCISGLSPLSVVVLDSVNTRELSITCSDVKEVSLTACNIGHLRLNDMRISFFDTFSNRFTILDVENSEFGKVTFDYAQTPLANRVGYMGAKAFDRAIREVSEGFNEFDFQNFPPLDVGLERNRRALQASTMQFLIAHSSVRFNRNDFAHAKHLLTLASDDRPWVRAIYVAVGSLIKPWRVLLTMLATISVFAIIFTVPCLRFNVNNQVRPLGFFEAAYFSGVAFTTIGFGDITPNGIARGLTVTEGIFGMLLASAFLVALTRKYID